MTEAGGRCEISWMKKGGPASANPPPGKKCRLKMTDVRFQLAPIELMKMTHAVFHRRLIGPDFAPALGDQRHAAGIHPLGDLVVFLRGLVIGRLFRFDKLALEQCDFLWIVALDHIERPVVRLLNTTTDCQ